MADSSSPRLRLVHPSERPVAPVLADDPELVGRAVAGSRAACAELFRLHAPRVLPMLVHLLSSTSDAEDALQDAFVQAFRDVAQLRDRTAFGGWLRQIAVWQAHRRFRRRRMLGLLGLDRHASDAALAQVCASGVSPEVRAELATLDRVLTRMPAPQRAAWILRHVEGYELTEVAALCRCSVATVKRRLQAARARVAKQLHLAESADE